VSYRELEDAEAAGSSTFGREKSGGAAMHHKVGPVQRQLSLFHKELVCLYTSCSRSGAKFNRLAFCPQTDGVQNSRDARPNQIIRFGCPSWSSAMPISSNFPPLDLVQTDIFSLLFERKSKPFPDGKGIFPPPHSSHWWTWSNFVPQSSTRMPTPIAHSHILKSVPRLLILAKV
jgi:hypothetical protein